MARIDGARHVNGYEPPPSSILASRVVNGNDATDFDRERFNQLLEESLGHDEEGQPNLGSDAVVNHKLIIIIAKAGIDPFIHDSCDNPFRANDASTKDEAQFVSCLDVVKLAVGKAPEVIHTRAIPENGVHSEHDLPLYAWLLPKLLPQLHSKTSDQIQGGILSVFRAFLDADTSAISAQRGENVTRYILGCTSVLLDTIQRLPSAGINDNLSMADDAFTDRLWSLGLATQGLASRLSFTSIGHMFHSMSLAMNDLSNYANTQPMRTQYHSVLLQMKESLEDLEDDENTDHELRTMLEHVAHLSMRASVPKEQMIMPVMEDTMWPDSNRARKRLRLSDMQDTEPAKESVQQRLSRKLTATLCGSPASDFVGLSKTAASHFRRLPEEQQCDALALLGATICQLSRSNQSSKLCEACDGDAAAGESTTPLAEEFLRALLVLVPSIQRASKARVKAMLALRQILLHTSSLNDLRLTQSTAGEWCLQSLRSSSRDLRIAAIGPLQAYVIQHPLDASLTRDNRVAALDFLQSLWLKNDAALQETTLLALTRMAQVVGDEELNLILLRLVEYLGHNNSYINGLVYAEIQQLAQSLQTTTAVLFRPYWRTIGLVVARTMSSRPAVADQICDMLGMRVPGLMLLIEEYALPYLVLNQNLDLIQQFATAHGSSTTPFDICTNPRNLSAILSFLLAQGFQDHEQKILSLLVNISGEFNAEDVAGWLAHVPIQVTCSLLKAIGDSGEGKSSRAFQGLQSVAQMESRKQGHHSSSSKRSEMMSSFLENNALAIVNHFTISLNDLEAMEPKLEKKRSVTALGEIVRLGKGRVLAALPQICACLRSALNDTSLCNAAFHAWSVIINSLPVDEVETLVDQTLSIIVKYWESFDTITQQRAYDLVAELLKKHSALIREVFETMPSLASIPVLTKFESEICALKQQMDERHQVMAFIARLKDENETVVEQALTELSPLLRTKHDLLQRSILREQPDEFIADLTRALLDCCVRFHTNTEVSSLCGQCLGTIGCLDANKIETTVERASIVVLSNFAKSEETVNFILFFLEQVLVDAFLSASTTRAQGFLGWAMQELLKLCQNEDMAGPRIRTGPTSGSRRWHDLPEAIKNTLMPFRTSRYRVQDVRPPEKRTYPFFHQSMRHKDWLRAIAMDFLNRAPGNNIELIFSICCRIIQGQNTSIPAFLLPYAVLSLITSGVQQDTDNVVAEILNVLQQSLDNLDRRVQEDIRLCSQSMFEVLDYIQKWLQQRKKQYSSHLVRPERGVSELMLENAQAEIRSVEKMLDRIPPDVLSRRAIECKSFTRALFHWEQFIRKSDDSETHDERLRRLQDIYAQIDEPDGIEGISAQMHIVDVQGRVLEHKKAGRWTAAQSWYQMELVKQPDDVEIQRNLMGCLKESGQYDLLLDRFQAITQRSGLSLPQLKIYAVEAAWVTGRWPELEQLLQLEGGEDFASHLGQILIALNGTDDGRAEELLNDLYRVTATELTPNAITSLQNSHDTLLRLHVLEDLRILKDTDASERQGCLATISKRLDILGSNVRDKQYILSVGRAAMQLRGTVFQATDIAASWLQTARLARKAQASAQAFDAVLKASALGDKSAAIEEAKLIWQDGYHRKAIQALEGAIESRAFVAHNYIAEDGPVTLTTEQQNYQNEITAKAYLLLGKWLDHAGQTQSEVIKNTFRKSTENFRKSEKNWYYLGRHYNKLLDSEKNMAPSNQNQAYLTGEMAKLVIENYLRSLLNGSKYVFQTLPKILTLWFELVSNADLPQDPRRGNEKFHQHNAAQRRRVIDETNNYIKRYVDRIQASVLYTILPQVVARICHTNKVVYEILSNIMVKVVRTFPNQALWTLLAVVKSQAKDRASRGLAIVTKVVEAQKKTTGQPMTPADLKSLIASGQRFSDEVLRVSEFPIEGKVSRVSLSRDLGFKHKIAPSKLVVPSESCLMPSIPTSYDSAYLKSFRAFAREPVTISAFLDEALVLASLQKPRKLSIRGSDGQIYGVLAKPKDDMRKDQRLMEFNTMINRFLKRDVEASKRRLYIRTYAVIPLNEECGLIEWVNNLKTFRDIILKLYRDKSITPNYAQIRGLLDESCSGPPEKVQIFSTQLLKIFPAVFHEWFVESFPDPSAWFNARLRYTRACAVMSIVGHVLGLGDRHGENIMFEEDNGSLMHVDFNCLFDKGLTFEKPEHVPFRLTHNMVDAFGAYGYEGPFRRCCEITLTLLRGNEDALMTILETFLHDPTTDFLEKERRKKKVVPGVPNTPVEVLEGVRGKVRGFLAGESVPLSVGGYVQEMIKRAVDERNLSRMYIGWCAFF